MNDIFNAVMKLKQKARERIQIRSHQDNGIPLLLLDDLIIIFLVVRSQQRDKYLLLH